MKLLLQEVREVIADLLETEMGIDSEMALKDIPLQELHKNFDSLALLEMQMILEEKYKMEFDDSLHDGSMPENLSCLSEMLILHHSLFIERKNNMGLD